jgi:hypothetical protein
MPKAVVPQDRITEGSLPSVCIVCGGQADHRLFPGVSSPSLAWALAAPLLGLLVFWGSILLTGGRSHGHSAGFPFCDRHRSYWPRRARFIVLGFLLLVVLMGMGFALTPRAAPGEKAEPHWILGVGGLWMVIYLLAFLIVHLSAVRPTSNNGGSVVLSGASRQFVAALSGEEARG